ncbi:MAG: histidine phosphatase family protein [Clostridia bacterium]|nr:histidine phosphatase family protein [Clostridia bacterium]
MKLILIRHGTTEANEKHLYCGSTDLPLSEAGRAALNERRQTVNYPSIAGLRVLTSGMKRCEETLILLYGDQPHEMIPAFREMDFGAFEMRSYEQMKEDAAYIEWITGDNEANIPPGGESGNMMTARVLTALGALIADGRDALLVTHGGVIAAIMAHLFPDDGKNRYEWQPKPGGGYVVDLALNQYAAL